MALSIIGTPAAAAATTITIPTHAAGDIIVMFAYKDGATTIPTVPSAGGTVPTWNTIDGPTGANTNAAVACWALATASNHTSGTWTGATGLAVINYRGANTSGPVGGHAQAGGSGANTCTAPALTLTDATGASAVLHFGGARNVTAWGTAPAGYTNQANVATEVRLITEDTTTTASAVSLVPTNATSGSGYRAQSIEVLAFTSTIYQKQGVAVMK